MASWNRAVPSDQVPTAACRYGQTALRLTRSSRSAAARPAMSPLGSTSGQPVPCRHRAGTRLREAAGERDVDQARRRRTSARQPVGQRRGEHRLERVPRNFERMGVGLQRGCRVPGALSSDDMGFPETAPGLDQEDCRGRLVPTLRNRGERLVAERSGNPASTRIGPGAGRSSGANRPRRLASRKAASSTVRAASGGIQLRIWGTRAADAGSTKPRRARSCTRRPPQGADPPRRPAASTSPRGRRSPLPGPRRDARRTAGSRPRGRRAGP